MRFRQRSLGAYALSGSIYHSSHRRPACSIPVCFSYGSSTAFPWSSMDFRSEKRDLCLAWRTGIPGHESAPQRSLALGGNTQVIMGHETSKGVMIYGVYTGLTFQSKSLHCTHVREIGTLLFEHLVNAKLGSIYPLALKDILKRSTLL